MPALPAVPKVVRCDFHFSEGADPNMQFREFFQYTGTLSVTDAGTWLGNMVAALGTFMAADFANNSNLVLSELTDLTSASSAQVQNSTGHTGGSTHQASPAGLALVIKKAIVRRYRGGHPRVYLPGIPNANLANANAWDPTALGNIVAGYQTFIAACVANTNPAAIGTITHVNVSYFSGFTNHTYPSGRVKPIPTPRLTPLIDTIVNTIGNPIPASQRRRNEQP